MPNYRRLYVPGGTYFFTVVTLNRRPLFAQERARNDLHKAIAAVREWSATAKEPLEVIFCAFNEEDAQIYRARLG